MAYDAHSNYHTPQRPYYNQAAPAPQPAYNDHNYNGYAQEQDYGYGGYQNGYTDGYYDDQYGQAYGGEQYQQQAPPMRYNEQAAGHGRMNGGAPQQNFGRAPSRPAEQGRGIPPRGPPPGARGNDYGRPMPPRDMNNSAPPSHAAPPHGHPNGRPPRQDHGPPNGAHAGRGERPHNANGHKERRPQQKPQSREPIFRPTSPQGGSFDNPFPVFPTKKSPPKTRAPPPIEDKMAGMSIQDGRPSGEHHRHAPRNMSKSSQGSGTPRPSVDTARLPPVPSQRAGGAAPFSPQQEQARGGGYPMSTLPEPLKEPFEHRPQPPQVRSQSAKPQNDIGGFRMPFTSSPPEPLPPKRSMTMPQNLHDSMASMESNSSWIEPGPVAGYYGPEDPSYIPPRPGTAGGQRRPQVVDPAPYTPPRYQPEKREDHYGAHHDAPNQSRGNNNLRPMQDNGLTRMTSRDAAIEADMPDFDNMGPPAPKHKRGDSFEQHLMSPTSPTANSFFPAGAPQPFAPGPAPAPAPAYDQRARSNTGGSNFSQQVHRSRSQPDLNRGQPGANGNGFVAEMPGDAPPVPYLPRSNTFQEQGYGGYGQEPQPARPNTANGRRPGPPPGPAYGGPQPGGPQPGGPQPRGPPSGQPPRGPPPGNRYYGRPDMPPMQRNVTDQSMRSDPGPNGRFNGPPPQQPLPDHRVRGPPLRTGPPMSSGSPMPNGPPGQGPVPVPRNGPMTPVEAPPRRSEDSLPRHPAPVRAGLVEQTPQQQPSSKPPPVRQYNAENTPVPGGPSGNATKKARRLSDPITMEALNKIRNDAANKPGDKALQLRFAKKLVEAAAVLADEGGRADARTKNKNRERYILEAHKLIKKLAHQGYAEAQFYLADCYGTGSLGLQSDPKEAFSLYMAAAKAGHGAAAYRTAVCCEMGAEEGGGTRKDPIKAVQWYKRAAALGDTPAMYKMGMIQLKGLLAQPKSVGEAVTWLKRAAERADEENPHALHELGLLYSTKAQASREEKDKIFRDEAYALDLFKQAAELGYKFSQFRLGEAFEYGLLGCPMDARNSIAWYSRAAAQEEHQSELALSGWYLTGSAGILEQSDTEAYLWARKAACADPPLAKAMFAMGYFTEVGIGCPQSLEEAKRWYGRAASYKFPKAQERLEELRKGGARAQRGRERLSRSNQRQREENCTVM